MRKSKMKPRNQWKKKVKGLKFIIPDNAKTKPGEVPVKRVYWEGADEQK